MYETESSIGKSTTGSNGTSAVKKTDETSSPTSKNALMKLKSYLIALRVWSLSASIIPTILGKLSHGGRSFRAQQWHTVTANRAVPRRKAPKAPSVTLKLDLRTKQWVSCDSC